MKQSIPWHKSVFSRRKFLGRALAFVIVLIAAYSLLLYWLIPPSYLEEPESSVMYYFKIAFVALFCAVVSTSMLVFAIRRDYFKVRFEGMKKYRYLLFGLVHRDFIKKYRRSFLGVLWSVLNPLLMMIVLSIVFSTLFRFDIPNYPAYILSGQLIYSFFAESTTVAMDSIIGNAPILKKVYVPKYIFPVSSVISSLVNLGLSGIALVLVFIFTRVPLHSTMLLFPIPIIYTMIFSLGLALFLSSAAVFFRDMKYLYSVFISALAYFTPLFYPVSILPEPVLPIISLNPLYHYVTYFRDIMLYGIVPDLWLNLICLSFSFLSLFIGLYTFMRKQDRFILYV